MGSKQKSKTGICEVHFYNHEDSKKRMVKWHPELQMYVCAKCNDPVLKATASINKKIEHKKNKNKK